MKSQICCFIKNESGATAIEYGLIAAGLAVAIITAMATLSGGITSIFSDIAGKLKMS